MGFGRRLSVLHEKFHHEIFQCVCVEGGGGSGLKSRIPILEFLTTNSSHWAKLSITDSLSHSMYVETNQIFALQTTAKARFTELCDNSCAPRLLFS